jgi:squalene-hopene/tetraprenyl-beta-curcumene cyclase
MLKLTPGVLGILLLSCCATAQAPAVAAQVQAPPARKSGTIFKEDVDRLVDLLTDYTRAQKAPALGGDSTLATAKILAAMARCHRRYYWPGDVPAVTQSVDFLIRQRKQDGSFGDAEATAWVVDALSLLPLEADKFAEEVAQARKFLDQHKPEVPTFAHQVGGVLDKVRADVFPVHLGKEAAGKVKAWVASTDGLAYGEAADALVQLVACQVANKALDKAAAGPKADGAAAAAAFTPAQQKAFAWLLSQQKHGVFSVKMGDQTFPDPAFTGFGLFAMQTKPKELRTAEEQAVIDEGLRWLLAGQNDDGTFGQQVQNYTTCVVVGAIVKAGDPAAKPALDKAQKAILGFQNIEGGGYQRGDRDYGSIGYGSSQRGDLSNLQFAVEALRNTGLPENHEAFQKALVFLQRTQNLKATNDFKGKVPDPDREGVVLDATSGDDGGAGYYPGNSNAGYIVNPDGTSVPRSYGSMTYALLKAYTLAGVQGDDPRVQAAVRWIQANWNLAINPGIDVKIPLTDKVHYQGLFYYYMLLAQALDRAKVTTVQVTKKDDKGADVVEAIDWRKALRAQIESMQQPDGTWVNAKNDRWMEGNQLLCTCYAMTALELCK